MRKPFYLKYVSSQGIEVDLTGRPYLWSVNNLSDYEWIVEVAPLRPSGIGAGRSRITRGNQTKNVEIAVYRGDGESVYADVDYLLGIFEADVLSARYGRLYIGEQYCEGNFTAAQRVVWKNNRVAKLALTFTTDYPFWITEASTEFITFSESSEVGKRFPYKFPHRHATAGIRTLINDHYAPTPAIITIYGPALDPSISINGQIYQMNISMATGERLVFDGLNRRIYRKLITGEEVNEFNRRDKNNDPFRPIPPGTLPVVYNGSFSFDITLIQQRSEPRWGG